MTGKCRTTTRHVWHYHDDLPQLPVWFLCTRASNFTTPFSKLFNQSIAEGVVTWQCKTVVITVIPSISKPINPDNFRLRWVTLLSCCQENTSWSVCFHAIWLVSKMTYYVSSGTLNSTLTHSLSDLDPQPLYSSLSSAQYAPSYLLISMSMYTQLSSARHLIRSLMNWWIKAQTQLPDNVYNWIVQCRLHMLLTCHLPFVQTNRTLTLSFSEHISIDHNWQGRSKLGGWIVGSHITIKQAHYSFITLVGVILDHTDLQHWTCVGGSVND